MIVTESSIRIVPPDFTEPPGKNWSSVELLKVALVISIAANMLVVKDTIPFLLPGPSVMISRFVSGPV